MVDWIKHAFVVKFNHISPTVYSRFTSTLCHSMSPQLQQHAQRHVTREPSRRHQKPPRAVLAPPPRAVSPRPHPLPLRQPSAPPPSPGPYPSSAPTLFTAERPPEAACRCMAVPAGSASRLYLLRPPGPPCMHCTCSTVHRAPCRLSAAFHPPGAAAEPAEHAAPLGHRVLPRGK